MRLSCLGVCFFLALAGISSFAGDQVVRRNLNEVLAQRADRANACFKLEEQLRMAWLNPRFRSAEVDALRNEIAALNKTLNQKKAALREKVDQLPRVKEMRLELGTLRAHVKALEREAAEIEASAKTKPQAKVMEKGSK